MKTKGIGIVAVIVVAFDLALYGALQPSPVPCTERNRE